LEALQVFGVHLFCTSLRKNKNRRQIACSHSWTVNWLADRLGQQLKYETGWGVYIQMWLNYQYYIRHKQFFLFFSRFFIVFFLKIAILFYLMLGASKSFQMSVVDSIMTTMSRSLSQEYHPWLIYLKKKKKWNKIKYSPY